MSNALPESPHRAALRALASEAQLHRAAVLSALVGNTWGFSTVWYGLLEGAGAADWQARMDAAPGRCCVVVSKN